MCHCCNSQHRVYRFITLVSQRKNKNIKYIKKIYNFCSLLQRGNQTTRNFRYLLSIELAIIDFFVVSMKVINIYVIRL